MYLGRDGKQASPTEENPYGDRPNSQNFFPRYKYEVSDFIFLFNCVSEQITDFLLFIFFNYRKQKRSHDLA